MTDDNWTGKILSHGVKNVYYHAKVVGFYNSVQWKKYIFLLWRVSKWGKVENGCF